LIHSPPPSPLFPYTTLFRSEAFGRVRIIEGDSVTITSNKADYDGNSRVARLRNNVVFTKLAQATLYTDYLDFDRVKNEAYYFNRSEEHTSELQSRENLVCRL